MQREEKPWDGGHPTSEREGAKATANQRADPRISQRDNIGICSSVVAIQVKSR